METVAEYLRRAEECERLAERIKPGDQRAAILNIAEAWRELADRRLQLLKRRERIALP